MTQLAPPARPRPPADTVDELWAELVAEVRRLLRTVEDETQEAASLSREDPDDHERQ